jgi:hypothetical protein
MGGQRHTSAARPPENIRYPLYRRVGGWAPGPVSTGTEHLAPTGFRSLDRPNLSDLLHRLGYPGQLRKHVMNLHS